MRRKACPHCGASLAVPWEEVDALLRAGEVSMAELARRYGLAAESLRYRARRLGLPPRWEAREAHAWEGGAVRELREARARCEEAMAALRAALGRLHP